MSPVRRRVAVVGSGVAGLTAAYILRHTAEVTLFEALDRCGGHAHTHDVATESGTVAVDSGFLVHNERTYPLLCRLFTELGVATQPTEMSMSVSCDGCGLEYCGARGLSGLFADPRNTGSARFWSLLAQVPRFHRRAGHLLETGRNPSLGEFLTEGAYSEYFVRHFVTPLVSAVWSCGPHRVAEYPARYLFQFLANHGMLTISDSPQWHTVTGGSRTYVDKIVKLLHNVHTLTPVKSVRRDPDGVDLVDGDGQPHRFDAVVIATHPDQALAMLTDATTIEQQTLSAFEYSHNPTVLHTDTSLLPNRRAARGSWNHRLSSCSHHTEPVRVSYDLTRLHRLPTHVDVLVTLGEDDRIPESAVLAKMTYRHPIYTAEAVAAQKRLPELNGGVTAFAGAYHGWGFHEDGCRSGVAAAESLGAKW